MRETNPCKGVERNREHHRRRYLSGDELGRLVAALADHPDRQAADAVRLLLLTGARRGEVLGARWGDIDLTAGTWSKHRQAHQAGRNTTRCRCPHRPARCWPASARSRATRNARSARSSSPRRRRDRPPRRDQEELGGARARPLASRTCACTTCGTATPARWSRPVRRLPLIGSMLGHASPATTARYSHMFADPQRAAAEKIGVLIENAAVPDRARQGRAARSRGRS